MGAPLQTLTMRLHVVGVGIGKLCCPYSGRVTHRIGDGVELTAVVTVTDPDHLAIGEADSRREAHGVQWW